MATCFTVSGSTFFPLDMLRYEDAYAASEKDRQLIRNMSRFVQQCGPSTEISLVCDHDDAVLHPERWESFGWRIVDTGLEGSDGGKDAERERLYASALAKLTPEEREALDWFRPEPRV